MNLTLQYDQVLFILQPTGIARSLARKRVTVIDYPDGRLAIRYNGVDLACRTFDNVRRSDGPRLSKQTAGSDSGLHRRAAEATRHVPLVQSTAPAWPEEPHVQGRIDGIRAARCAMRRLHAPPSQEAEFKPNP